MCRHVPGGDKGGDMLKCRVLPQLFHCWWHAGGLLVVRRCTTGAALPPLDGGSGAPRALHGVPGAYPAKSKNYLWQMARSSRFQSPAWSVGLAKSCTLRPVCLYSAHTSPGPHFADGISSAAGTEASGRSGSSISRHARTNARLSRKKSFWISRGPSGCDSD